MLIKIFGNNSFLNQKLTLDLYSWPGAQSAGITLVAKIVLPDSIVVSLTEYGPIEVSGILNPVAHVAPYDIVIGSTTLFFETISSTAPTSPSPFTNSLAKAKYCPLMEPLAIRNTIGVQRYEH